MLLFSAFCLLDTADRYKHLAQQLIRDRFAAVVAGAEATIGPDPNRVGYYLQFDYLILARELHGDAFVAYLQASYEPTDVLFRLAEESGVVLLNGGGFDGPAWSVRVSLANLNDADYVTIGRALMTITDQYVEEWRAADRG
jgi:aspartate 4-decarboxylase